MNTENSIQVADFSSVSTSSEAEINTNGVQVSQTWEVMEKNEEIVLSRKWKKPSETMTLVNHFINEGMTPKEVLAHMLPNYSIPATMTDEYAVQIILEMFSDKRTRDKLPEYNTFEQAVELFRTRKNILVLTGAGVSVSCGIPDFRSANGIYARLHNDFPELPDPQAMFDIDFFRKNPSPFFNFAKEIFPGQFKPSVSHMFIKFLEDSGQLLRNYTQNIDTLEQIAGINRVIECHGSFSRSTCLDCKYEVDSEEIKADVLAQRIAYCKNCKTGVMKPNIVFFGEDLGAKFHEGMADDSDKVDLLVVIGSSLKVQPVALIPFNVEPNVPQILINREQLTRYNADIKLLGNCDDIILSLCLAIGGEIRLKMLRELETRPGQFPDFLERFREAVSADTAVMPRILSVKQFKNLIDKRRRNSAEALCAGDVKCDVEQPPSAKRVRIEVDEEITTTTAILSNGECANAMGGNVEDEANSTSCSCVVESTTGIVSSMLVSSSSPSFSASEAHSTTITTQLNATNTAESTANETITSTTRSFSAASAADSDEVLWESNYVDVSDALPFNTFLHIPSNLNVFKGAEMYYDRDSKAFCRRPGPVITRFYDDAGCEQPRSSHQDPSFSTDTSGEEDSESDDDDTSNSDSILSKTNSVPTNMKYASQTTSVENVDCEETNETDARFLASDFLELDEVWSGRSNSCPVDLSRFPAVTVEDCEAILNDSQCDKSGDFNTTESSSRGHENSSLPGE